MVVAYTWHTLLFIPVKYILFYTNNCTSDEVYYKYNWLNTTRDRRQVNCTDRRVGVDHRQGIDHGDYNMSCHKFIHTPIIVVIIIMFII